MIFSELLRHIFQACQTSVDPWISPVFEIFHAAHVQISERFRLKMENYFNLGGMFRVFICRNAYTVFRQCSKLRVRPAPGVHISVDRCTFL